MGRGGGGEVGVLTDALQYPMKTWQSNPQYKYTEGLDSRIPGDLFASHLHLTEFRVSIYLVQKRTETCKYVAGYSEIAPTKVIKFYFI